MNMCDKIELTDNLLASITCPITHQIFLNPVIISDGNTYECDAIHEWLKNHDTSPLTGVHYEQYETIYIPNNAIKHLVDIILQQNKNLVPTQYKKRFSLSTLMNFVSLSDVQQTMKYASSVDYSDIIFEDDDYMKEVEKQNGFKKLFNNFDIMKIIIDKYFQFSKVEDGTINLLHLLCKHSSCEIINYAIDKNMYLEYENTENWRPIHLLCCFHKNKSVEHIINKNINLECVTQKNSTPIHVACFYNNIDAAKILIKNNVDTHKFNSAGLLPLHNACQYGSIDIIKLMINNTSNINQLTLDDQSALQFVCHRNNIENIVDIIKYMILHGAEYENIIEYIEIHMSISQYIELMNELKLIKNS